MLSQGALQKQMYDFNIKCVQFATCALRMKHIFFNGENKNFKQCHTLLLILQ